VKLTKTERTRRHIIETTAPIFNKKGFAGTSITDLTQASQLTSGSIYGNFANKEEVAFEALNYNLLKSREFIERSVSKGTTMASKLLKLIGAYRSQKVRDLLKDGCPMQNALIDAPNSAESLRECAATGMQKWKELLTSLIKQGITNEEFKRDTEAEKTALHIIALLEFSVLMFSGSRNPGDAEGLITMAEDVVKNITR
jgi:TetR/AcrR family transcriptional repressor of nem operon